MSDNEETVPCKTCGEATPMTGTKRCNGCWEVENRLDSYLRRGGRNAQQALVDALWRAGAEVIRDAQARAVRFVRKLTPTATDRVINDLANGKVNL